MDINPTPFPVKKPQCVKSKYNRKFTEPPIKAIPKEPSIPRPKRVFGTSRNPNIPANPATQKPITKSSQVPSKSTKTTQLPVDLAKTPVIEPTEETPEKNRAQPKKKTVCFQEKTEEIVAKSSNESKYADPKTPVKSPYMAKPRLSGPPYYSAQRCSDCRFDRLETSAYWLGQIKVAESVGKHFVSAAFFQLGYESKSEPIRNLRVEVKNYMGRHENLSTQKEWINVCRTYGLLKEDEMNGGEVGTTDATEHIHDQETKEEAVFEEAQNKGMQSL